MLEASQRLDATGQYRDAFAALNALQVQLGSTAELKAIARYLLYSAECHTIPNRFPWVGAGTERDRLTVETWEQAWESFLVGDDED